ncbi:MAG: DUF2141 domain-containing protein [Bacteroidia bacterium]|nr:DUF2141 domain-containing protein [Bacteroidia bacterium]
MRRKWEYKKAQWLNGSKGQRRNGMMIKKVLSVQILLLLIFTDLNAQNVEVIIKGIRSDKGHIGIGVFKDDPTFQKEEPLLNKIFVKSGISNREMEVRFSLEPGIYGFALLDDENSDGLMEYNFLGIPKEGFGFSDYYHKGFTKPKFDSFKFRIVPNQKRTITIRIRYM